jgi:hypothetical protein
MPKPTRSHDCGTIRKNMPETTTGSPGTYHTKHDYNRLTWRVIPPETPCPSADHDPLPLIRFRDCRNAVQVSESPVSDVMASCWCREGRRTRETRNIPWKHPDHDSFYLPHHPCRKSKIISRQTGCCVRSVDAT